MLCISEKLQYNLGIGEGGWYQGFFIPIFGINKQKHFQNLFKDNGASNIGEIMKVIRLFPRLFDEEVNVGLEASVSKEELKVVLSSFKNAKSPGPDVGPSSFIWDSMISWRMIYLGLLRSQSSLKKCWGLECNVYSFDTQEEQSDHLRGL
jgi:hypothetical protein